MTLAIVSSIGITRTLWD